ncbi:GIY-YIG nuclease family protein [Macrococcoides canis]|uniref:GIY-YIG nuclease family protein n=1 Tax=Macrococcoides canis TaxID=1855823 RepID=UPI002277A4BE|nr:GIY-YIG nuclease family protein [Macrococcus canis]
MAALENQKAVYLITDKSNGKLYVGLATSMSKMLLTRWSNYVANGHGGNKELVALVEEKGFDYVKENFQYTILENYNGKVDDKLVLQRESYWKEALQSRQFGYNSN